MSRIKLLPPQLAQDEIFRQRFRREAEAAARLNDPHVIPIHSFGEIDGRLYVDMRLIEGRDLHALLAEGPLTPARAVAIIEQVAPRWMPRISGLVHRDVKPSNILIAHDDFAYLIDFGIARVSRATADQYRDFVGTLAYMAPERFTAGVLTPAPTFTPWRVYCTNASPACSRTRATAPNNRSPDISHKTRRNPPG